MHPTDRANERSEAELLRKSPSQEVRELRHQLSQLRADHHALEQTNQLLQIELTAVYNSTSWKISKPLRSLKRLLPLTTKQMQLLREALGNNPHARRTLCLLILRLLFRRETNRENHDLIISSEDKKTVETLHSNGTLLSICAIIPHPENSKALRTTIEALIGQAIRPKHIFVLTSKRTITFPDASIPTIAISSITAQDILPYDSVLVCSSGTTLHPYALAAFAVHPNRQPNALTFCDELFSGSAVPFSKPQYSPILVSQLDILGPVAHFTLCGTPDLAQRLAELVNNARSTRSLIQQLAQTATYISHLPFALASELGAQPPLPRKSKTLRSLCPSVSIIIPTRDHLDLLQPCIESIIEKTQYPSEKLEIMVVDNGSKETATLAFLDSGQRSGAFRVIRDERPFNYSRLNNLAVHQSSAEICVFLNNDTLIFQDDWLDRMVARAVQPEIGAVGCKLLYEDHTVQHGGVVLGIQGVAAHIDVHLLAEDRGYFGFAQCDREVSAVTGACLAIERKKFDSVGGFDEHLAVAFNDILLCVTLLKLGYNNLQMNSVQVIHLESKSRGLDDTAEKRAKFMLEARYARLRYSEFFLDDRFYNPCLSLYDVYKPADPPRRLKPWRTAEYLTKPRILMLSSTHQIGHGVPLVIAMQADHFLALGWEVQIGGPKTESDFPYLGCKRVDVQDPLEAARYASRSNIDIVLCHTPPFFSVSRWLGPFPVVAALDYGEPNPDWFPDAAARKAQLIEKSLAMMLAHRRYGISNSVKAESKFDDMVVVPLGNSHMKGWSESRQRSRDSVRSRYNWSRKIVVLNVCRFHRAERLYKGVDIYCDLAAACTRPQIESSEFVFILAGKADVADVKEVQARGVQCFSNLSDEELEDLYCAADIYANFSQWEGWNLGIAQALAFGLPVVASDIPAHRDNFDIVTVGSIETAMAALKSIGEKIIASNLCPDRMPLFQHWAPRLKILSDDLLDFWRSWSTHERLFRTVKRQKSSSE